MVNSYGKEKRHEPGIDRKVATSRSHVQEVNVISFFHLTFPWSLVTSKRFTVEIERLKRC